jgi:protein-disulfide isomerase
MKKLTLFIAIVLIALPVFADEKRFTVPLGDSPALGPPDAPVTIIEFLDFQ